MFLCAFADASFIPLPTSMFFIGIALLNTTKTFKIAWSALGGTILGMLAGYLLGHFAWQNAAGEYTQLAQFFFHYIPGFSHEFYEKIRFLYSKWDFLILLTAGYSPVPMQFFSISAGVFSLNVLMLLLATVLGQSLRFFVMGYLIQKLGPEVKRFFDGKMKAIAILSSVSILAALVILIKVI